MSDTPETDAELAELGFGFYTMGGLPADAVKVEFARNLERECNDLREALSLAGKLCHEVHHPKSMQHGGLDPCPVEALIQQVLYQEP